MTVHYKNGGAWYACRCGTESEAVDDHRVTWLAWELASNGWREQDGEHLCPKCSGHDTAKPEPNLVALAREFLDLARAATGEKLSLVVSLSERPEDTMVTIIKGDASELGRVVTSACGPVANNVAQSLRNSLAMFARKRLDSTRAALAATEAALAALTGGAK